VGGLTPEMAARATADSTLGYASTPRGGHDKSDQLNQAGLNNHGQSSSSSGTPVDREMSLGFSFFHCSCVQMFLCLSCDQPSCDERI